MMEYSVVLSNATVTAWAAKQPWVWVNPAASGTTGKPNLEFIRFWAGQSATATSAQQPIAIEYMDTTFGTHASVTPTPLKIASPVSNITGNTTGAAGTAGVNCSTPQGGTAIIVISDAFNNLNGYLWVATPKETIVLPAGYNHGVGLYPLVSIGNTANWNAGCIYAEV